MAEPTSRCNVSIGCERPYGHRGECSSVGSEKPLTPEERAIENAPWGDTPVEYRAALKALHEAWGESGKSWPEFIAPLARHLGGEAQRAGEGEGPTVGGLQALIAPVIARYYAIGHDPDDPEDEAVTQAWEVAEEAAQKILAASTQRAGEPTPERIERVAKAICEATSVVDYYVRGGLLWDDLKGDERDLYRAQARAALDAARQPDRKDKR